METITLSGERGPTRITVGAGLLEDLPRLIGALKPSGRIAAVTNTTVGPIWGRRAAELVGAGVPFELPDGEVFKAWPHVERLCRWLLERGWRRGDVLMAVGGGVTTDMTGFAAAVYLRGIRWMAVPTTLLAMIDASVGGKTGINLDAGKNLIGAFWAPALVVADVGTLETLPERELRAGLAEAVKTAWIGDHGLLDLIPAVPFERTGATRWEQLIVRAIRVKVRVVEADERERGQRQALNLGHTLGHALEAATGYERFLHGEAVAWGLCAASRLASARGLMTTEAFRRLNAALAALGPLPPLGDLDPDRLVDLTARDKKADGGGVAWVLPTADGVALGQRVSSAELRAVIVELQRSGRPSG